MNRCFFYIIGICILICIFSAGCKKMLDVKLFSQQKEVHQIFSDKKGIQTAMNGLYLAASSAWGNCQLFDSGNGDNNLELFYSLSDETDTDALSLALSKNYLTYTAQYDASYDRLHKLWANPYAVVAAANLILEKIPNATAVITEKERNQWIGECLFLRAYSYWYLTSLFGEVPLVLSSNASSTLRIARSSKAVIWQQIENDLLSAVTKLSPTPFPFADSKYCNNSIIALALLARVYLYEQKWQEAVKASNQVINSPLYALNTNGLDFVFLQSSKELLFTLGQTNPNFSDWVPGIGSIRKVFHSPFLTYLPLNKRWVNNMPANDKRKAAWVGVDDEIGKGTSNEPVFYCNKFESYLLTPNLRPPSAQLAYDYPIIRLSEIYLIRAEAQARLGNVTASASDLNMIRSRAGALPTTSIAAADLLKDIDKERCWELFGENHRWFDLCRSGEVDNVMRTLPHKFGWSSYKALLPIPAVELSLNPNLKQNAGY